MSYNSIRLDNTVDADTTSRGEGKMTNAERLIEIMPTALLQKAISVQKDVCLDKNFQKSVQGLAKEFKPGKLNVEFFLHVSDDDGGSLKGQLNYSGLLMGDKPNVYDSNSGAHILPTYGLTDKVGIAKELARHFSEIIAATSKKRDAAARSDQKIDLDQNKSLIEKYLKN